MVLISSTGGNLGYHKAHKHRGANECMNKVITLSPAAITRILELMEEESDRDLKLRVYIIGGGCSGFQYQFAFEKTAQDEDTLVEFPTEGGQKVAVLLDLLSYPYLVGSIIDYEIGLYGARFVVQNPNAKGTCGCGSSFSVE